jgi:predicted lysophospholipase L1 biosynthesis ABC-type transport system permease subunit
VAGAPTRATLAGLTVALLAIVAVVTFGASLSTLHSEPERYGWATDLVVTAGAGYDTFYPDVLGELADDDDAIEGVTVAGFTDVELDEQLVPAMGVEVVRGDPPVTLLEGRLPSTVDETVLGRRTARRLEVGVGDSVSTGSRRVEVVGLAAFPAVGPITAAHPAMGEGALFLYDGLTGEGFIQPGVGFFDLADGVDPRTMETEHWDEVASSTDTGVLAAYRQLQPAELDSAAGASTTVGAIAAVLGSAAVAGLAIVVMASARARRHELALLRVLGFTQRDLRRSVRWQATSLAVVAVVVGLPVGIAAGRVLWREFADALGVEPSPTIPLLTSALVVIGTIVLAAAAALPATRRLDGATVAAALRLE